MAKPRGFMKRPPGPLAGLWSWRYLDLWKTLRMVISKRVRSYYEAFPQKVPTGTAFPDIELATTHGNVFRTADLLGTKHFVLVTGATT
jgi:hypothetical protein